MRVQADHWAVILDFCEKYPQIITNKFNGLGGRSENVELWQKLTIKLNSLGFGEKTVEGWKKTLIDWKSKTKAKAGTINAHVSKTGGGTLCNLVLTSYEERLLTLMGKSSYEGNPVNVERGFRKRKLFIERPNEEPLAKGSLPTVHSFVTDHSYIAQDIAISNESENELLLDYELPVVNETVTLTNCIKLNAAARVIANVPTVHSYLTSSPSTSTECDKSTNYDHTFSPFSRSQVSLAVAPDIPKVHSQGEDTTPIRMKNIVDSRNSKERGSTRNKRDTEQLFRDMQKDLLHELRNINLNIGQIVDGLKEVAVVLKKK